MVGGERHIWDTANIAAPARGCSRARAACTRRFLTVSSNAGGTRRFGQLQNREFIFGRGDTFIRCSVAF